MTAQRGTKTAPPPIPAEPAAAPAVAEPTLPKVVLDPDQLNMGDMRRARERLGRDPWPLLAGNTDERDTLVIWCVRARTDPEYTWEQAEAVPFADLEPASEPPLPPIPEAARNGSPHSGTDTTT